MSFRKNNSMPLRVSITGIDGAGKDTVARRALTEVSAENDLTAIKLGRPAYRIDSGESKQIFRHTTDAIDRLHNFADEIQNPKLILAVNAMNVVIQTRIMESSVLRDNSIDIIASSRDPRIDPVVYLDYYGGKGGEKISKARRGRIVQALTNVSRDLIILLQVSPELAVERIEQRIREDEAANGTIMRQKWRHIHENVTDLTMLANGYEQALEEPSIVGDTEVVRIQTDHLTKEQVIDEAKQAIINTYRVHNGS